MQGNFKYPGIKKIHQILEKITRFDQKGQNPLCLVITFNCCVQKYTTHQFTYFIYYSHQDKFKNYQNPSSTSKVTSKTIFIILLKLVFYLYYI